MNLVRPHNRPAGHALPLLVPVPRGVDVHAIIADNDHHEDPVVAHLVLLEELVPTNKHHQACTAVLRQFRRCRPHQVERLFNVILSKYSWAYLPDDASMTIYVRAHSLKDIAALRLVKDVLETACAQVVSSEPPSDDSWATTSVDAGVVKTVLESMSVEQKRVDVTLYKVDNNELVDVPLEMRDKIVQELIEFRSSMLIKEQQKRSKELSKERLKAKQMLTAIFNKPPPKVVVEEPHEMPELSEPQYQEYLHQQRQKLLDSQYHRKLGDLNLLRLKKELLKKRLAQLQSYEDDLVDNKFRYMEALRGARPRDYMLRLRERQREEEMDRLAAGPVSPL